MLINVYEVNEFFLEKVNENYSINSKYNIVKIKKQKKFICNLSNVYYISFIFKEHSLMPKYLSEQHRD